MALDVLPDTLSGNVEANGHASKDFLALPAGSIAHNFTPVGGR